MNKENNHLSEKIGFRSEKEMAFPSVILIASSNPCNLKCHACPCTYIPSIRETVDPNGKKTLFLSLEVYKKITDECLEYSSTEFQPRIRISGYGEPLLNKHLIDMIEYSCAKSIPTSLITNGLLLTENKAERLINANIESIEISVDAHEPELYSRMRIGGDFAVLKQNVKNLIEIRNKLQPGKETMIIASIVRTTHNHEKIENIEEYWKSKGVDRVSTRNFLTWGVPALKEMQNRLEQEAYLHKDSPCPYPFERLMIDPAGWIRLCPYDDQKKIPDFGHAGKTTLHEVWAGKRFKDIRNCHQKIFDHKLSVKNAPLCSECEDRLNRSWTYNYLSIAKSKKV